MCIRDRARPARAHPAAVEVDHRVWLAGADRPPWPGRRRRPDARLRPHRPGARDDPADPLFAAHAPPIGLLLTCLLYTSDAADERSSVHLGGRRIIKKKKKKRIEKKHTQGEEDQTSDLRSDVSRRIKSLNIARRKTIIKDV